MVHHYIIPSLVMNSINPPFAEISMNNNIQKEINNNENIFPSSNCSINGCPSISEIQNENPSMDTRSLSITLPDDTLKPQSLSLVYCRDDPVKVEERRKWLSNLLADIYDEPSYDRDMSDSLTDTSTQSDQGAKKRKLTRELLEKMNIQLIYEERHSLETELELCNQRLMKAVRQKAHQKTKSNTRCSILTAVLQAKSSKSSLDSRLKFNTEPQKGENGMTEWIEAMKAVARLPGGIPDYFRLKLWKTLAEHHIESTGIDWKDVQSSSLSDRLQDNDELIHSQIIKDLHRTGWEGFQDEKKLKQLLLAYARYNKDIGYCQGFNIIGALILQVVDYDIPTALKVFIFLIEQVIPKGYFDQSLRALSVDMSVLRDLLQQRLPKTMQHLEHLQNTSGNEYEPALTNVFSMHWLLTLFATCLPRKIVYRIWDAVMLEGSEVLLRTALGIWARISKKILTTTTADQFYDLMEKISVQLMDLTEEDQDNLITVIYTMAPFPYPGLVELREKYTWNIQPLSSTFKLFQKSVANILHDDTDESNVSCSPCQDTNEIRSKRNEIQHLQEQYRRLLNRQRQASVILKSAFVNAQSKLSAASNIPCANFLAATKQPVFNHLRISNTSQLSEHTSDNSTALTSGTISLTATMIQPTDTDIRALLENRETAIQTTEKGEAPESLITHQHKEMMKKSKALLNSFTAEEAPILPNTRSSRA